MKRILGGVALGGAILLAGCKGAVCQDCGFGEYSAKTERLSSGRIPARKTGGTVITQNKTSVNNGRSAMARAKTVNTTIIEATTTANNKASSPKMMKEANTLTASLSEPAPMIGSKNASNQETMILQAKERLVRQYAQTLTKKVVNRWLAQTNYSVERNGKPRLIITQIENRSDLSLTEEAIRTMFNEFAAQDGRFNVVVATQLDGQPDHELMRHILNDPYYSNNSMNVTPGKALQCFAKIQVAQVATTGIAVAQDYLIDVTLSDIENRELVISDWDILGIQDNLR